MTPDTHDPALDRLVPPGERIDPDPDEAELRAMYAYPTPGRGRAVVRANMVSSVDGGAWGTDHRSGTINDAVDARVFAVLRSLADAVLVGAGTARAERYGPLTVPAPLARRRPAPLEVAVVTMSGVIPVALTNPPRPAFIVTGKHGADAARAAVGTGHTIVVGPARRPPDANRSTARRSVASPSAAAFGDSPGGGLDLAEALDALAERNLAKVLCEGGPSLLGALLAADLVDELCLTTTPTLVGAGPGRVVAGPSRSGGGAHPATILSTDTDTDTGPAANVRPLRLIHLLHCAGTTLARWAIPTGP